MMFFMFDILFVRSDASSQPCSTKGCYVSHKCTIVITAPMLNCRLIHNIPNTLHADNEAYDE